jgi:hypothetical protein
MGRIAVTRESENQLQTAEDQYDRRAREENGKCDSPTERGIGCVHVGKRRSVVGETASPSQVQNSE